MISYVMLICATVLYSFQFLSNQKFEEECGSSLGPAMLFSLYSSIGGFVIMFVMNGFKMEFSPFAMLMAAIHGIIGILYVIAGNKALGEVNLSAYSVFAMLGGMLLPSVYGIVFCGEGITVLKILCYLLMAVALMFTINFKEKSGKKIYYFAVFVLNGLYGVISVIHNQSAAAVDSCSFLMLAKLTGVVISFPFCLAIPNTMKKTKVKPILYSLGYAACNNIGNWLTLLALMVLPASVQYPIITGGVMVISLLISIARKEDVGYKNIISTAIAFVSTVLIAL